MFCIRLSALLLCAVLSLSANAQDTPPRHATLLTISADAEAHEAPDIARLSTGVVTQASDANSALRANASEMDKVMAALKAAGIHERDIQTSGINLNPQYRHARNEAPAITGYQARNTVSVTVRDIARLGDVVDALVASGANQIDGPYFTLDAPGPVLDRARVAALANARARAKLYADALGVPIKRIISIHEGNGAPPIGLRMASAQMASDEASFTTPVSPGQTTLRARVTVVFALGD